MILPADEAFLVPLPGLVLHFLHACLEDIIASDAAGGELRVVAAAAVDSVCLGPELLVYKAGPALGALKAGLVPMLLFIGQVLPHRTSVDLWSSFTSTNLAVYPDDLSAFLAVVCEDRLVAADAVRLVLSEHVAVTR